MKWKLKKDLPWAKAGEEFEISTWRGFQILMSAKIQQPFMLTQELVSDWFEEVDERWEPELNEKFFLVEDDGSIDFYNWYEGSRYNEALYSFGNCFRTRELAERAAEQIKALLKEFHKNNP